MPYQLLSMLPGCTPGWLAGRERSRVPLLCSLLCCKLYRPGQGTARPGTAFDGYDSRNATGLRCVHANASASAKASVDVMARARGEKRAAVAVAEQIFWHLDSSDCGQHVAIVLFADPPKNLSHRVWLPQRSAHLSPTPLHAPSVAAAAALAAPSAPLPPSSSTHNGPAM
jgi:hypothetical protein